MDKVVIIYVPGLGDATRAYDKLVPYWKLFGLNVKVQRMDWEDGGRFEPKLKRVTDQINAQVRSSKKVALVGVSAGGSAVLNAFSQDTDKITAVVSISGFLRSNHPKFATIAPRSQALAESVKLLDQNEPKLSTLDRQKILTMHPIADQTVPPEVTTIKGSKTKLIPGVGHVFSIVLALITYPLVIKHFIKQNLE